MLLPTAVADILTPLTQEFLPLQGVHAATAVRGYTNAHGAAISNFPSQQRQEGFVFKHPLTVNMLGPTCCCKTYFCLCRTVWRWYGILPKELCGSTNVGNRCMMSFRAKFTPKSNIFKEYFWIWIKIFFINPKTRNIVILDDLMLSASKDSRIDELFTNDSRHRSLSVIAINQKM